MSDPETSQVLANVNKHIKLDGHEVDYFTSLLKPTKLARNQYLLQVGQPCTTFNYVINGALRAFYRDEDEKEATIMFAIADWWITDMPSFVSGQLAMIHIQAIKESTVLQLTKAQMDHLLETVPKFEKYFRILMQNAYVREQLRMLQNLSLTAEARYDLFLNKYPHIAQEVPLKNIASYLGITPEFLSTIRSKISKR